MNQQRTQSRQSEPERMQQTAREQSAMSVARRTASGGRPGPVRLRIHAAASGEGRPDLLCRRIHSGLAAQAVVSRSARERTADIPPNVITFILVVLVIACLALAKPVILPAAVAILLAFILNPFVSALDRRGIPRVPSVFLVVLVGGDGLGMRRLDSCQPDGPVSETSSRRIRTM